MKISLAFVLVLIYLIIALIHFNWALGGQWGFAQALPTTPNGERVLNPRPMESAIVGTGLFGFALFYLLVAGIVSFQLPSWFVQTGSWLIPIIFILRAIGDFKYVGFFKQVQQTEFAQLDTIFYSPLCLLIGILGLILIQLN